MDAFYCGGSTASLPFRLEVVKKIQGFHMGMAGFITMVIHLMA